MRRKLAEMAGARTMGVGDWCRLFVRVGWAALRGIPLLTRQGVVLRSRGVKVSHKSRLRVKGVVVLEEYVELQCDATEGIALGRGVSVGAYTKFRPSGYYGGPRGKGAVIEDGVGIGPFCYIGCSGLVTIERDAILGPGVRLIAEQHAIPADGPIKGAGISTKAIRIGSGAWVGASAVVLAGVTIGEGAVVGAGSVVTRDVAPFAVVAGVPARKLRDR